MIVALLFYFPESGTEVEIISLREIGANVNIYVYTSLALELSVTKNTSLSEYLEVNFVEGSNNFDKFFFSVYIIKIFAKVC